MKFQQQQSDTLTEIHTVTADVEASHTLSLHDHMGPCGIKSNSDHFEFS